MDKPNETTSPTTESVAPPFGRARESLRKNDLAAELSAGKDFIDEGLPEAVKPPYIITKELEAAVDVAVALQVPLLVAGEPGTGKSELARTVAYHLGLPKPLRFDAKTGSTAQDLFYRYNSLRRFLEAQLKDPNAADAQNYIDFEALGKAIVLAMRPQSRNALHIPTELATVPQRRSVVLIDEIDKAPRDFPNDILNEIDRMEFKVAETGKVFRAPTTHRPVVILTSNRERVLPAPFLRRCVFHFIRFPDKETLEKILRVHKTGAGISDAAISHVLRIRDMKPNQPPGTAELIQWVRLLEEWGIHADEITTPGPRLVQTYGILLKHQEDIERVTLAFHLSK